MSHAGRGWAPPAVAAAAYLTGVFLAGVGAAYYRPEGSSVAFWWPAAGLAVAMVASLPRAWAPGLAVAVAVVSGAANLAGGQTPELSAAYGVANALEALVAGLALKDRSGRMVRLTQLSHFLRLLAAALAGALVVGVLAGAAAAVLEDGAFLPTMRNVVASHTAATMVIVSVVMSWDHRSGLAGRSEYVAQVVALSLVIAVVFVPFHSLPLSFVPLPFLVWAALRLDPRTVTLELLLSCLAAVLLTARGRGPFGDVAETYISLEQAAPLVQAYIFATTLVALPLTLAVTQRARALEALSERERLFRRNFTESMTGMVLLARRGDRLEIVDANDAALEMLDDGRHGVLGRYLDRVLTGASTLRSVNLDRGSGELEGWRGHVGLAHRPGSNVKVAISPLTSGEEPTYAAQLLDVSAEYDALARTAAAERLTSATLDTTRCIILVADMSGTVVRVNHATTAITGFPEEQLLGRPVWESIVPTYRVPVVQAMFAEPDGSGIPGTGEADVCTAAGETLRVVWTNDLVRDADGTPQHAVMTGVDVTAERTTAGLMTNLFQAGISTAIIGIDSGGRITLFNSGAESLVGWTAEEVRGTLFTDLLEPEELAERTGRPGAGWSALTALVGDGHESQLTDWTWRTATGGRRTVAMTLSGGGSQFGAQTGYLVVGRDVTEQRHSQVLLMAALEKERMAADRLRQLDTAKNEFVSTVSHELRTPVTSIVGYAELLADGSPVEPDPEQLPLLDTIARNGARLISLCNDLLTLAGLDSEGPAWTRTAVDLRMLVDQAEDSLRPTVRERDLALTFDIPSEPVTVLGDAIQLERVLLNLLSNAVKFTPDGGSVTTRLHTEDGEACVAVTDTGIGIPREEQDELFQRFFRASTAQDLAIQGTGLGLSIVAGIVAVHGGRIGVESESGSGTTFSVRLPLATARP
ncbi:ATP-binding protein [Nocardioides sp. GXQ0305]|uniref:ATP-binding protein n=1 Tax=Nocardioides sp. GXQ0305 TaxID=3423912 RepID=UPI003D7D1EF3